MTTINQLTAVDTVSGTDQIPIYSSASGDARKAALSVLLAYMRTNISAADNKVTQYSAPSATGFSVAITDSSASIWLVLTPTAGFAAGTIVLPAVANCIDKQEILVNSTQSITTLTITANGSTVTGAPTTMAANAFFTLRFEATTKTWYRVG